LGSQAAPACRDAARAYATFCRATSRSKLRVKVLSMRERSTGSGKKLCQDCAAMLVVSPVAAPLKAAGSGVSGRA
jgi:hypothetical protein